MNKKLENERNFHLTPLLVLRQRAIVCDHANAARSLLSSIPPKFYEKIDQIGTTRSGRPRAPNDFAQWFARIPQIQQMELIGKIVVVNVNLGYAYEHGFKLLLSITGKRFDSSGRKGHNLHSLFKLLPEKTKKSMCRLHKNLDSTDLEIEEFHSECALSKKSKNHMRGPRTLPKTLEYYQSQRFLQHSRYKFTKMDVNQPVRILLPIRFEKLIWRIVDNIIDPSIDEYLIMQKQDSRN